MSAPFQPSYCLCPVAAYNEGAERVASHRGFEIGLVVGRDIAERRVLSLVLVAHAAARQRGHRKSGSAKSSVEHSLSNHRARFRVTAAIP